MTPSTDPHLPLDQSTDDGDDRVIGTALRWSLLAIGLTAGIGLGIYFTLPKPLPEKTEEAVLSEVTVRQQESIQLPRVPFTNITQQAGISFIHENGASAEKLLPETMGGGCAFLDFDNDGDQDLLLTNSCIWPWNRKDAHQPSYQALYENDGTGQFKDVTQGSGLDVEFYGMGPAVADYDGDGLSDIYVTAVGKNYLFRNLGDGKFQDVTVQSGVAGADDAWGTSSGWFDYDNDGDLDLFVCNYLEWNRTFDTSQNFQLTGGDRAYGRPQNFGGTQPYLFRNNGDGTFEDIAKAAGLHVFDPAKNQPMSKSLGVVFTDLDQDGWTDLIVANDSVQNFLFHNQQDGTFREIGGLSGIAFDDNGNARGAMGIDIGAFRNSSNLGVVIGNFSNEMMALYVSNSDNLLFVDEAIATGLGPQTRLRLTFGVFFFDYDFDTRLDVFCANGHLENEIHRVQASQTYEQPPLLFRNCGAEYATEFVPVPKDKCGADLLDPMVGRGTAYADIDNDGDLDIVIAALGSSPRVLRNDCNLDRNWIRIQLEGDQMNIAAIGAIVEIVADGQTMRRQVSPTRSYLSQVELPLTFGLGGATSIDSILVIWPDGSRQAIDPLEINQTHTITKSR